MWENKWSLETPGHDHGNRIQIDMFLTAPLGDRPGWDSGAWRTEWCPWLHLLEASDWPATVCICKLPSERGARKPNANPTSCLCPWGRAKGHQCLQSEPGRTPLAAMPPLPDSPEWGSLFSCQWNMIMLICSPVPSTSPPGEKINTMFAYTITTLLAAAFEGLEGLLRQVAPAATVW